MIFFVLFITVTPYVLGHCIHKFIDKKRKGSIYQYLLGVFSFLCFFQMFHMAAIQLSWSFSQLTTYFTISLAVVILIFVILFRKSLLSVFSKGFQGKIWANMKPKQMVGWVILAVILMTQCLYIIMQEPYQTEDMSKEIILTTIYTDSIYQVHPLTGKVLEVGITPIGKLNSLPILYSVLVQVFALDVNQFLYVVIPIWTLLLSYFACYILAQLFLEAGQNQKETSKDLGYIPAFLIAFGMVSLIQSGSVYSVLFRQLFEGWSGTSIVTMAIYPFFLYGLMSKNLMVCILALGTTLCVANPGEGLLLLVLGLAIYGITLLIMKLREVDLWKK